MSVSIGSIEFRNFRCLRETTLPLSPFTLLVGPNGSGKSTTLEPLSVGDRDLEYEANMSVTARDRAEATGYRIAFADGSRFTNEAGPDGETRREWAGEPPAPGEARAALASARHFVFMPTAIREQTVSPTSQQLAPSGANLAGVLARLAAEQPDRFEAIGEDLCRWFTEFDRVEVGAAEGPALALRTRKTGHAIAARHLSDGNLLALALLTLAHLPDPPAIVGIEEPDRGIHPRLLPEVRDALYRLSYPQDFAEDRDPVQVIATTHSPYLLDLFREHPEEVVIAQQVEDNVKFQRLSDLPDVEELLGDAPLGEAWYSGILGGVPTEP